MTLFFINEVSFLLKGLDTLKLERKSLALGFFFSHISCPFIIFTDGRKPIG